MPRAHLISIALTFLALLSRSVAVRAADCTVTSVGFTPLNDLGAGLYLGQFQGGLYPDGSNVVPSVHAAEGRARALAIQPIDGKYVLLSIGMSNTTQEFCSQGGGLPCDAWTFMGQAAVDPRVNNTTLSIVNGALGGQAAATWDSPTDPNYNRVRDNVLAPQGLTESQVQIVWIKVANPQPTSHLPNANADAYILEASTANVLRACKTRYPNLKLSVNGEGAASIQRMLLKGELDMGVIAGHKVPEGLASQHFLREEIVACVPAGHPLAGRDAITLAEFLREPLIFFKQGYYMRELMDELVAESRLKPQVVFETNLFSLVRSLVKERLGISTFLRMVVSGDPELRAVSFDPPLHLDLVIAWRAGRYLSRANRAFIDFLLESTGGQPPS